MTPTSAQMAPGGTAILRLLHSSDLLIGSSFPHAYPKGEELRGARFRVLEALVGRAQNEKAQALILAGNTLADNRLSEPELKRLGSILKSSKVPVYLLPGITDPLTADSPYRRHPDLFAPPIHVLSEARPVRLEGATLFPIPVLSRREAHAPSIPVRQAEDGLRIGIACGPEAPDLPDLDYLAMGGRAVAEQGERIAWSGTPEAIQYGQGRGRAYLVTLSAGAAPSLKSLFVGYHHWLEDTLNLKSLEKLREALDAIKEPTRVLQRLVLRGALSLPELKEGLELLEQFSSKLYHLQVDDHLTLAAHPEEHFQEPLLRNLARNVSETENPRPALLELYELAGALQGG